MPPTRAPRSAVALVAISAGLVITSIFWGISDGFAVADAAEADIVGIASVEDVVQALGMLLLLAYLNVLGLAILRHSPGNIIGWLMLGIAASLVVSGFGEAYVAHGWDGETATLPAVDWVALMVQMVGPTANWLGIVLLLLLFPNGRFLTPRWRFVFWFGVACLVTVGLGNIDSNSEINGIEGLYPPVSVDLAVLESLFGVAWLGLTLVLLLSALCLILRAFRSTGIERQQMKMLAVPGLMILLGGIGLGVSGVAEVNGLAFSFVLGAGLVAIPLATTLAITRYRLYDIDVLVNRTIVYVVLTIILATAYLVGVTLLQALLPVGDGSDLAVAASTLAVAALFRPARRRVQELIDRSFYRRRYDAVRTVADFSARLRSEIDLDAVNLELLTVVSQTMHPAHVSIWMKPGEA